MVAALALAGLTLRAGLRLRAGRHARAARRRTLSGARPRGEVLRAHLRMAKPAVILLLIGFVGGPAAWFGLRGGSPFEMYHAGLGLRAAALFVAAAVLGKRLQEGRGGRPDLHGLLGLLGVLAGAVAAMAGMVLLP
jgi:hypothetical protein